MEAVKKGKALKGLLILILIQLFFVALLVWFFDPFYQYHAPFFGMDAVLNDRDNQMPGTIRNFSYDSVLVGSSLAENFDSTFLDETYGCSTLKIIRASGSMADLLYYLDMAQETQDLRNIFWCLDLFALDASTEVTLLGGDTPTYLHTPSVLDDLPYVYNKEIILEKIPSMLAFTYLGINTGGEAYNWARHKEFGAAQAMRAYDKYGVEEILPPMDLSESSGLIEENLAALTRQIATHPDIQYRFLIPPYSLLWWDCAYVNGQLEERYTILEETIPALLAFDNVEVYFFQSEEAIVCQLDNYMDMVHYSPVVSQYMLDSMAMGRNRVTEDNWPELFAGMQELADRIITEEIYRYYPLSQ